MVEKKSDKYCCPAASFVDKPCEYNVYKQFQLNPNQKLFFYFSPRENRFSLLCLSEILKGLKNRLNNQLNSKGFEIGNILI